MSRILRLYSARPQLLQARRMALPGKGGPLMPMGTTTVDFGAFPGAAHTTKAITGQATITGTSLVEAWMSPAATADHSVDEHIAEDLDLRVTGLVAGTGFTIEAVYRGIGDTLVYGLWNVGWVWV